MQPVRDESGLVVDYVTHGDFPTYGNDDDRADLIAADIVRRFINQVSADSKPTGTPCTPSQC